MNVRPYRHYSETDLYRLASDVEADIDAGDRDSAWLTKQLAIIEAEIAEREFEQD